MAERQTSLMETPTEGGRRWKNPNEVVRIRRKLSRKPSLKLTGKQHHLENVPPSRKRDEKSRTPVLKRASGNATSSPTPPKRPRSGLQDISNSPLFSTPEKNAKLCLIQQVATPTEPRPPITPQTPTDSIPAECPIPMDWSLKTKVRFVSPFPFTWSQSLKPHHEATGITQFMANSSPESGCDKQASLQRGLMVWCHPSLPFLKTFPRTENRQRPTPALLQDEQSLQTLKDDWSSSLCSVYQLLKCGVCPYFYLCANQFTVLFASAGVQGCPSISAMITPTTSGMRETLRKEGAELNLPLEPTKLPGCDEECSDAEDDSAATSWLTTVGLPATDLPSIRPQRATLHRSHDVKIDNRPESLVHVEGPGNVHILFNYLLTSKTTITTTGSHAGIPPTILSPIGFKGATLKALKVRQGNVQELSEGQMVQRFYFELSGPTLPHNTRTLARLFRQTQHGQFTAHMTNVDPTGAFNGATGNGTDPPATDESTTYLQKRPLGQKHGPKKLVCEGFNFTWE